MCLDLICESAPNLRLLDIQRQHFLLGSIISSQHEGYWSSLQTLKLIKTNITALNSIKRCTSLTDLYLDLLSQTISSKDLGELITNNTNLQFLNLSNSTTFQNELRIFK
jgi:hypothetical protein